MCDSVTVAMQLCRSEKPALYEEGFRSMKEKRETPRVFFEDTVRYEGENVSLATIAYDISEKGIFIKTLRPLPVGNNVRVYIPNLFPENPKKKVPVFGVVIRHFDVDGYPRGMVIKFTPDNDKATFELIQNYVISNRFYISHVRYLKSFYDIEVPDSSNHSL